MNLNVSMEVTCPNCNQANKMEGHPVANDNRLKTVCPCCCFQFYLERQTDAHVKVRTSGVFDMEQLLGAADLNDMDWMVDSGFSKGFCYDIKGLGSLIRNGLLSSETRIKPPGTTLSIEASQIVQLKPFFEEMTSGKHNRDLVTDHSFDSDVSNEDLNWFQIDDSDYFKNDILPHLQASHSHQMI